MPRPTARPHRLFRHVYTVQTITGPAIAFGVASSPSSVAKSKKAPKALLRNENSAKEVEADTAGQ